MEILENKTSQSQDPPNTVLRVARKLDISYYRSGFFGGLPSYLEASIMDAKMLNGVSTRSSCKLSILSNALSISSRSTGDHPMSQRLLRECLTNMQYPPSPQNSKFNFLQL